MLWGSLVALLTAALIICGVEAVQHYPITTRVTPTCVSGITNSQLKEIRQTVRNRTRYWNIRDQKLLDLMTILVAEKLGVTRKEQ